MWREPKVYGCPVCGYEQGGDMTAGDAAKFIVSGCEPAFVAALLDALLEAEGWKRDDGIKNLKITYVTNAHIEGEGFPIYIWKGPNDGE